MALRSGSATVTASGVDYEIGPDDVVVTEVPREGWTVASDSGESLALDLALTPELIGQGIARDVTRLIQDARKTSGLDISDRISVTLGIWK
jgi:isoleucyl-tRNA synthetase